MVHSKQSKSKSSSKSSRSKRSSSATSNSGKKPVKPRCAYNFFYRAQRKVLLETMSRENPQLSDTVQQFINVEENGKRRREHKKTHGLIHLHDLTKIIAREWNAATPERKRVYEKEAERDKIRFKQEMALFSKEGSSQEDQSMSLKEEKIGSIEEKKMPALKQHNSSPSTSVSPPHPIEVVLPQVGVPLPQPPSTSLSPPHPIEVVLPQVGVSLPQLCPSGMTLASVQGYNDVTPVPFASVSNHSVQELLNDERVSGFAKEFLESMTRIG